MSSNIRCLGATLRTLTLSYPDVLVERTDPLRWAKLAEPNMSLQNAHPRDILQDILH